MGRIRLLHGSIVGFDGKGVWFRTLEGHKSMTLLNRARQDGCGQPCIMIVEDEDEKDREFGNDD